MIELPINSSLKLLEQQAHRSIIIHELSFERRNSSWCNKSAQLPVGIAFRAFHESFKLTNYGIPKWSQNCDDQILFNIEHNIKSTIEFNLSAALC